MSDDRKTIQGMVQKLTGHSFVEVVTRGNAAIEAALSAVKKKLLIPAEGGWIHYQKAPKKLGLGVAEVQCDAARINLPDLERKLKSGEFDAFLYQNPGGYFAEQPMQEIYEICGKNNCLVIMDVSGAIGTKLCDGRYADILVGSFGEWKLVEAHVGGFVSVKDEEVWARIKNVPVLKDDDSLQKIHQKLVELPSRIKTLETIRKRVIGDVLKSKFRVVYPADLGFVVVVPFSSDAEKERIINYCQNHSLPWTECPRYIRVMEKAISIEIKQLA